MLIRKKTRRNLLETRSMFGLLRDFGNSRFAIEYDRDKEIFSIGTEDEARNRAFDKDSEKGGIIVLSTDMNAVSLSNTQVVDWVKKKYYTLKNRIMKGSMLDKIADRNGILAMTVGYYLQGRYRANNGEKFSERSVSVEIIGIDEDKLFAVAEDICRDFQQECVLVKSYRDEGVYFVDNNYRQSFHVCSPLLH